MSSSARAAVEPAAVLGEHRAIRAAADALRAHLRLPGAGARARWLERLAEDVAALARLLRPHFAHEEEGMFEAIEAALPESAHECSRLRSQHGGLLDRLAALERKLHGPRHDAKAADGLRRALRALLADLARHEASENALLLRAMEGEEVAAAD